MDAGLPGGRDAIRATRCEGVGFPVLGTAWMGNALVDARIPGEAGPCDHEGGRELSETRGGFALGVRRGAEASAAVGSEAWMRGVAISRARC